MVRPNLSVTKRRNRGSAARKLPSLLNNIYRVTPYHTKFGEAASHAMRLNCFSHLLAIKHFYSSDLSNIHRVTRTGLVFFLHMSLKIILTK